MVIGFVNVVSSLLVYKYKTIQINININFLSIFFLHKRNFPVTLNVYQICQSFNTLT